MEAPYFASRPAMVHRAICDVLQALFPNVSDEYLLSATRDAAPTSWVRQIGMYMMTERYGWSRQVTAQCFERDRTTVLHGARVVRNAIATNTVTAAFIDFIDEQVFDALRAIERAEESSYG